MELEIIFLGELCLIKELDSIIKVAIEPKLLLLNILLKVEAVFSHKTFVRGKQKLSEREKAYCYAEN